jgi:zinc protease
MGILPHVTLEEINAIASGRPPARNRVILANAPEKEGVAVPDEARLLAVVEAVRTRQIEPYQDVVVDQPLLARIPEPAAIVEESTVEELSATEWQLANGVRVVLKPTDFQDDQVMLRGVSPGGASLVPDSLYIDAMLATSAAGVGGLGELSQQDLRRVMTGKTASASASIGSTSEAITGSSTRKDIETMLQLVYLRFMPPRRDSATFASFTQANQAMLANRAVSPQAAFGDTITLTMAQNHPRAQPITAAMFDDVELDRALAIYSDRFADASDFTFIIVGDFDTDSIRPLVQRYLGGLPSIDREETGRDIGIRPPTGVITKVVRAGTEPQSQTYISFTGPFEYSHAERHLLASMGEVLENRLLEKLREALGGTYSVSVSAGGARDVQRDGPLRQCARPRGGIGAGGDGGDRGAAAAGPDRGRGGQGARSAAAEQGAEPEAERVLARQPERRLPVRRCPGRHPATARADRGADTGSRARRGPAVPAHGQLRARDTAAGGTEHVSRG